MGLIDLCRRRHAECGRSRILGVLILGNSILEGVGTALLIPPVYILTTLLFQRPEVPRSSLRGDQRNGRALERPMGPLIGGLITTAISWRAAFVFQAIVIAVIVFLSRGIEDPLPADPNRPFDTVGAILSAAGPGARRRWASWPPTTTPRGDPPSGSGRGAGAGGVSSPGCAAASGRATSRLLSTESLSQPHVQPRRSLTQNVQWLMLMGTSFVVSAYLQVVRGYNAIQTGVIFTAATLGILVSSLAAGRLAKRYQQKSLIRGGICGHDRGDCRACWSS